MADVCKAMDWTVLKFSMVAERYRSGGLMGSNNRGLHGLHYLKDIAGGSGTECSGGALRK